MYDLLARNSGQVHVCARDTGIGLHCEIEDPKNGDALIARLGDLLDQTAAMDWPVAMSCDHQQLAKARAAIPGLGTEGITDARHLDPAELVRRAGQGSSVSADRFRAEDGDASHDAGVAIRCCPRRGPSASRNAGNTGATCTGRSAPCCARVSSTCCPATTRPVCARSSTNSPSDGGDMRNPITSAIPALAPPPPEARLGAAAGGDRAAHALLLADWPCFAFAELHQAEPGTPPERLRVASWNIERCRDVEASAARIREAGADIVLATEMDCGMARTGQRHTTRELAALLGMGYAFAVEFVELGLGDLRETAAFAGQTNHDGLHGNAILSRLPLARVAVLPLDAGGDWFAGRPKNDTQLRVGGRMAIAAEVTLASGPATLVSVHYESVSDGGGRAEQTERLLALVGQVYGDGPCIIGGDLNTKTLEGGAGTLAAPARTEPAFDRFAAAGFEWRGANTGAPTTRLHPYEAPDRPLRTLDWLLVRGLAASDPMVVPALAPDGTVLSDHEMIVAEVAA